MNYIGGQFWVSGWYWGGAFASFFREVCQLDLPGDLWDRARAYEATMESACWWWPHRRFVMVCERPTVIHRELVNAAQPRGWGSHRLHCETGPAVAWPDGWGVWAIHGVRVSQQVVEAPHTLTAAQIRDEPNAEVRRIMLARFGFDRFVQDLGLVPIQADARGSLYRCDLANDEPLMLVRVQNSTTEPDGSRRWYTMRVDPKLRPLPPGDWDEARQQAWLAEQRPQPLTAHNAVASLHGLRGEEYHPVMET